MSDYDKDEHSNYLNNSRRSEYPHTNESLLSLDNTLLCDIEADSRLYTSISTSSQERNSSMAEVSKQDIKTNGTAIPKATRDKSSDSNNLNNWQEKTLMNQVFAQFDSQNEEIASDNCGNITSLDIFDMFSKEDTSPKPANVCLAKSTENTSLDEPNTSNLHKDELNVSCLHITNFGDDTMEEGCFISSPKQNDDQDKSPIIQSKFRPLDKSNIPRKKLCLNDITLKSEQRRNKNTNPMEYPIFYGLPDTVKKFIQEVKGICELYRMFSFINFI